MRLSMSPAKLYGVQKLKEIAPWVQTQARGLGGARAAMTTRAQLQRNANAPPLAPTSPPRLPRTDHRTLVVHRQTRLSKHSGLPLRR